MNTIYNISQKPIGVPTPPPDGKKALQAKNKLGFKSYYFPSTSLYNPNPLPEDSLVEMITQEIVVKFLNWDKLEKNVDKTRQKGTRLDTLI